MNRADMLKIFGWDRNGPWANGPGPGHSKEDRSLGVRDDPNAQDEFRVYSLAGDDPKACHDYINSLLQSASDLGPIGLDFRDPVAAPTKTKSIATALCLWNEAEPIEGTLADFYVNSRGCAPATGTSWSSDLRFRQACPFGTFSSPALIGLMRDAVTGEPTGIHRTALSDDGSGKRAMPNGFQSKMMLGRASGAAIQLYPAGTCLGLAEGIETALSARKIFKVPVWAAMSATGIRSFPLIHDISLLVVFADNDAAGLSAAHACGCRYSGAGIDVEIRYPPVPGSDWNDFLQMEYSNGTQIQHQK